MRAQTSPGFCRRRGVRQGQKCRCGPPHGSSRPPRGRGVAGRTDGWRRACSLVQLGRSRGTSRTERGTRRCRCRAAQPEGGVTARLDACGRCSNRSHSARRWRTRARARGGGPAARSPARGRRGKGRRRAAGRGRGGASARVNRARWATGPERVTRMEIYEARGPLDPRAAHHSAALDYCHTTVTGSLPTTKSTRLLMEPM